MGFASRPQDRYTAVKKDRNRYQQPNFSHRKKKQYQEKKGFDKIHPQSANKKADLGQTYLSQQQQHDKKVTIPEKAELQQQQQKGARPGPKRFSRSLSPPASPKWPHTTPRPRCEGRWLNQCRQFLVKCGDHGGVGSRVESATNAGAVVGLPSFPSPLREGRFGTGCGGPGVSTESRF